ncbi:MAG: GNAT family N-acetyltransferase [Chloroflexi bacterium]|nr:GNAT family N-acetyltransferase [Chloroflexota bacterium]
MLEIRERRPGELPLQVDIYNAAHPPDFRLGVEEARSWESVETPEDRVLRLLAFEDGVAAGAGVILHRTGRFVPGRFRIDVSVRPEYQRQGIGRALYYHLLAAARAGGATTFECSVIETELPKIEWCLHQEDFHEVTRMRPSKLALATFDPEQHRDAAARAAATGVTFTTLRRDPSEADLRKLWGLVTLAERDVPHHDTPRPDEPFERFRQRLAAPHILRDCLVIARDGDDYVGFTIVGHDGAERAHTMMTGVHPAYRNRGIATELKIRCAILLKRHGYKTMRTFNHVTNPAMLAVNTRLGYVPLPEVVIFVKTTCSR